jgi:TRAP transporter TAXI family solute receptor
VLGLLAAALGCGLAPGSGGGGGDEGGAQNLLIGTAGEGGTYFYVGQGMAAAIEENTDLAATSQGTAGGTENVRRISSGEMDIGITAPDDIQRTIEDGTADPAKLRVLMSGHATVTHIAVRADSEFESLEDLMKEGRRLGVGEPGSNVQNEASDILALYGLTLEDVEAAPLSQSEQARALQDGEIEGAFLGGGIPLAAASEIGTNVGVRILPIPDDKLETHLERNPAEFRAVIPGGTYEGTPEDVQSSAYASPILAKADLPDDVAYKVTKTFIERADDIERVHPAGAEYTLEDAFRGAEFYTGELGLQFHEGAIRYYKEQGVWDEKYE